MRLFIFSILLLGAYGHGNMNLPLPRNNYGQVPINTPPGASSGPSCLGNACGWFQAGCFIGCPYCSNASSGADVPCYPDTADCYNPLEPTLLDEFRTYNLKTLSPNGDWTRSNPWRAPGRAPMHDSCGLSGAYDVGPGVSGYPPLFPGSKLPPTDATVWQAGGVAEVGWSIWSNHGGGYQYRLCPADSSPTENCFQSNVLLFATSTSTIRSPYGHFGDFVIPASDTNVGTYPEGSVWRKNPIPACNCDLGYNCSMDGEGTKKSYENNYGGGPCPTGFQFLPPWETGFGYWGSGAHNSGDSLLFTVVDKIAVPNKPGKYLLSWRWDCENSPQVWGNCADINIV